MLESKDIMQFMDNVDTKVNNLLKKFEAFNTDFMEEVYPVAENLFIRLNELVENAELWHEESKIKVESMVEVGWFPNPLTFTVSGIKDIDIDIDDMMISHLDRDLDMIERDMLKMCPSREHILQEIFELHRQKRFIASIPLIFAQADGICGEEFGFFFKDAGKAGRKILRKKKSGEIKTDFMTELMLIPFTKDKKEKLNIRVGSETASKAKGANRHAVLHGNKDFLDYGTELNGYKALSFLVFIISFVKLMHPTNETSDKSTQT